METVICNPNFDSYYRFFEKHKTLSRKCIVNKLRIEFGIPEGIGFVIFETWKGKK